MIHYGRVESFCKDDITKIENYDKAISDTENMWHCHHRLELTLDGEFANNKRELIRLGMYYKRPYFELIFLTEHEHKSLHARNQSELARKKMASPQNHPKKIRSEFGQKFFEKFGKHCSEDPVRYNREKSYHVRYGKCSWE